MANSLSGLTDEQAQEFHNQFKTSFQAFVGLCAIVHFLVWVWKPWF